MYKVDFSLCKWNFTVYFNKEEDYLVYRDVIANSVYDMSHKEQSSTTIYIYYINDQSIYNAMYEAKSSTKKEIISSFQDEYYDKYDDLFVSSNGNYLINRNDNSFNIICREDLIRPELIYLIREIYVRLQENDKALFMHGNGIEFDKQGLILLGNSGSGKTTFMFKLFDDNHSPVSYLSNDRIFLKDDDLVDYFPIPLILANGTARGTKAIFNYLKNETELYDSSFSRELLINGDSYEKFALFKKYIPSIFPNCELKENSHSSKIILPKINFDCTEIRVNPVADYKKVLPMCFTPVDYESLRKPWIMARNMDDEELYQRAVKVIQDKVDRGMAYTIDYNPEMDACYIQDQVRQKVLVKE